MPRRSSACDHEPDKRAAWRLGDLAGVAITRGSSPSMRCGEPPSQTAMNKYGSLAMSHWEKHQPDRYRERDQRPATPAQCFGALGHPTASATPASSSTFTRSCTASTPCTCTARKARARAPGSSPRWRWRCATPPSSTPNAAPPAASPHRSSACSMRRRTSAAGGSCPTSTPTTARAASRCSRSCSPGPKRPGVGADRDAQAVGRLQHPRLRRRRRRARVPLRSREADRRLQPDGLKPKPPARPRRRHPKHERQLTPTPILTVSDLAALPRGRIVVMPSGASATLAQPVPWWETRWAEQIRASITRYDPSATLPPPEPQPQPASQNPWITTP